MSYLNNVILIGRLTRDIELRHTPSGTAVSKFTIAVNRRRQKDSEEKKTDFIDVVVWGKLAETCAEYIGKGRLVAVEGELHIRSYDDSQGIRRKAAEVVANTVRFLDRSGNGTGGYVPGDDEVPPHLRGSAGGETRPGGQADGGAGGEFEFSEEDIPF